MKHTIMAAALIPACFAFACGTKKDEKKVPAVILDQSSDSKNPTSLDSNKKCDEDDVSQNQSCVCENVDVSQNQSCTPAVPLGELRIVEKSSWLNMMRVDACRMMMAPASNPSEPAGKMKIPWLPWI
jgi:hypothetical protein